MSRGFQQNEAGEWKPFDEGMDANAIHIKVIDVVYGNSSLNMTPGACSEQAHRIAAALIAAGLIRAPGQL
jgi:hypothetical protein